MITENREYRGFGLTLQDEKIIEGMAVVFETETVLFESNGIKYKEKIARNALNETDMRDVVLVVDHQGKPAARTKNGTLKLEIRNDGLYVKADLNKNETGRELYEDIKNNFFETMSFAFTVSDEKYDSKTNTRTILKIDKIYDVSVTTFAAYETTSVQARKKIENAEAEIKALEEATELRKKLILKTYF